MERRFIALDNMAYIVLDEVDRMIDLGFAEDVNYILDNVPISNRIVDGSRVRR